MQSFMLCCWLSSSVFIVHVQICSAGIPWLQPGLAEGCAHAAAAGIQGCAWHQHLGQALALNACPP